MTTNNGSVRIDLVSSASGWETRCWNVKGRICNPNELTGSLRCCPRTDSREDPCHFDNQLWPTIDHVNNAVGMLSYDRSTYNKFSTSGFRNYMEGFNVLTDDQVGHQDCAGDELCQCEIGGSACSCETED